MPDFDPQALVERLRRELPGFLWRHAYIAGSVAVALHFRLQLQGRSFRTKDADIVVQPIGENKALVATARALFAAGWTYYAKGGKFPSPGTANTPDASLPALRLIREESDEYFVEFLGLPRIGQRETKRWRRVIVGKRHFGVPCFRFMGLTERGLRKTPQGIRYADPAMMSLANLLSHPTIGTVTMDGLIGGKACLRSAKDLGRALAIAQLMTRADLELWVDPWMAALRDLFPRDWRKLGREAGSGLRALLEDDRAMGDVLHTVTVSLLYDRTPTRDRLRTVAHQLLNDVLDPLAERCRR